MIDVARARAETPGCGERIHLNNAGASLMSRRVLDTQLGHLRLEARIGGYEAARATEDAFEDIYQSIARLIGSSTDEIALVENATAGWNLAFHSIALQPGDTILTAEAEYAANFIAYLKAAKDHGARVQVIPSDETGQLDIDALRNAIDDRTRLISITHVPTNGGLVNPAEEVGTIAREAGVPYLLDACQSVGQLDLDVDRLQCDFLAATGRKYLRGPRGTGFLYVRRSMLENVTPPMVDLHGATWMELDRYELRSDARRYENWEFNHAAVRGLGVAVDEAMGWGLPAIEERVVGLGASLRSKLTRAGFDVYDLGRRLCGIVSVHVPGIAAVDVRDRLFERAINVSVTTPSSTRIDAERRGLPNLLRLSVHYFNTDEELDSTVSALTDLGP
jgi:selenocysteine lyase/cysteine desulfurase